MHIRVMLKKTSVFCREQQQNQQTWLQSRKHNPTLPEAGVSISNSSSFGYWSAPPSSPLILSRLPTLSSATENQMLTIAEHLKISLCQWWEFHPRKHYKLWKSRKKPEGVGPQTKFSLREKGCFFTSHAFPQVASQSYGPPQLSLILRDTGVTQRKLVIVRHLKNTRPIAICLSTVIRSFHFLGWLLGVYFFKTPTNLSSVFFCIIYIIPLGSYIFLIVFSDHHLPSLKFYSEI